MWRELCLVWNRRKIQKISLKKLVDFPDSNSQLGIAVGESEPGQLHCGIVYKRDDQSIILHLLWHHTLGRDTNMSQFYNYLYVEINSLTEERIEAISSMCEVINYRHHARQIPYGIVYTYGTKFENGLVSLDQRVTCGLTCATFILSVFNSAEIKLIDIKSWRPRRSDVKWHEKIVKALEKFRDYGKVSPEHVEQVRSERGCARFRPEEVAASGSKTNFFANFGYCVLVGYFVVKQMKRLFPEGAH
jgi:hypothetical protein